MRIPVLKHSHMALLLAAVASTVVLAMEEADEKSSHRTTPHHRHTDSAGQRDTSHFALDAPKVPGTQSRLDEHLSGREMVPVRDVPLSGREMVPWREILFPDNASLVELAKSLGSIESLSDCTWMQLVAAMHDIPDLDNDNVWCVLDVMTLIERRELSQDLAQCIPSYQRIRHLNDMQFRDASTSIKWVLLVKDRCKRSCWPVSVVAGVIPRLEKHFLPPQMELLATLRGQLGVLPFPQPHHTHTAQSPHTSSSKSSDDDNSSTPRPKDAGGGIFGA